MIGVQWPPADPGWPGPAIDEAEDAVSSHAETGVKPGIGRDSTLLAVEIDRDPLVAMVMGPGERRVDERVPDSLAARSGPQWRWGRCRAGRRGTAAGPVRSARW